MYLLQIWLLLLFFLFLFGFITREMRTVNFQIAGIIFTMQIILQIYKMVHIRLINALFTLISAYQPLTVQLNLVL